jgi:hypothetical protein
MWSPFRLFIPLPRTGPSAGHPKFFQYLSVIFLKVGNDRNAFLPSRRLGVTCPAFDYFFSLRATGRHSDPSNQALAIR